MRHLNSYSLFLENNSTASLIGSPAPSEQSIGSSRSSKSIPTNYDEFETMFEKYIQQSGGINKNSNLTEENTNSWIKSMMDGGDSDPRRQTMNEGGGMLGILIGGVLSAGKLLDLIGQLFRHLINWGKSLGFIVGKQWKSTKLEEWGDWYTNFLKTWVFKPIAKALLVSVEPFLQMVEAMFNKGQLGDYSKKEDVDILSDGIFYAVLLIVLTASAGSVGHAIGLIMIGKLKVLAVLKTLFTSVKIWEIKHYILGYLLKFRKTFDNYTVGDIAHSLTECHEDYGLKASLYYDFDKFTTTKVFDCVMKHLEHH